MFRSVLALLLLSAQVSASTIVLKSFSASSPEQAIQTGGTFMAQDAFQLQGRNGLSSILYSDEFPITLWGESRPIPGAWEDQDGVMQRIRYGEYPEDWFDIQGFVPYGNIKLRHWHILKSPELGTFSTYDEWPWFGLGVRSHLRITDDDFYIYRASFQNPGIYTVGYQSSVAVITPEPGTVTIVFVLLFVLCLYRKEPHGT